jgi:hypothetical protein
MTDRPVARRVTGLVGVYRAEGGIRGELAYVVGKLLGSAHCSLCDVTHSRVRRKPEWDSMAARLGVPVVLVHLNEMTAAVAQAAAGESPVVLVRGASGELEVLLGSDELEGLGGSVTAFEEAVRDALAGGSWALATR